MIERERNRFIKYFGPLIQALRSTDPKPMRPAEARAWIRAHMELAAEDLSRLIINGKQSIFENDVHWARFYLAKAGLIGAPKRGLWGLTETGRTTQLTPDEISALYVRVRDASRFPMSETEEDLPAPDAQENDEYGPSFWFVGTMWGKFDDQTPRFLAEGLWQNGSEDKFSDRVLCMKPGDRIAVKASFVQKHRLPFDVGGKPVSGMRIKATGTILENLNDGVTVRVGWDAYLEPREWYFYTYRTTIVEANRENEDGRRLIEFVFEDVPQDYAWFLAQPYWVQKYGVHQASPDAKPALDKPIFEADEIFESAEDPVYGTEEIIAEGCFLLWPELTDILERWRLKKNLILQGPPGTGKTWLAKRLGYALVGSNNREITRSRLRVVQFHPSLTYEDFVRGWRPSGEGRLSLVDGILMQAIEASLKEPDLPFVLVIEEVNRGNPTQIFGEMLTLLENTKRRASERIELAYPKEPGERIYVPANLYVIGTMNVADRSLAIVDLALRRRFAFVDLEPRFDGPWLTWCAHRGLDEVLLSQIKARIEALNDEISSATSLGPQFRIGHSYLTPDGEENIQDGYAWYQAKVDTEIGPLLEEYWYDSPETAKAARTKLLARLV